MCPDVPYRSTTDSHLPILGPLKGIGVPAGCASAHPTDLSPTFSSPVFGGGASAYPPRRRGLSLLFPRRIYLSPKIHIIPRDVQPSRGRDRGLRRSRLVALHRLDAAL